MAVVPVYGVQKRCLLSGFEHVIGPAGIGCILYVDLAIAKVRSQPLVGYGFLERLGRTIRRAVNHCVIMQPAIGIRSNDRHGLQSTPMQLRRAAENLAVETVRE